ncbi:D-2-hydroxyacid dehydrogenase [Glutamicibacter sp. AOP5-A2-18]|uniref:D-2-hydroxyacid dehydrogenase n=1 Tax=Glutamicibacter sp. AOP5-A2-18 TaxID=3457656 RepID=UPI004034146F
MTPTTQRLRVGIAVDVPAADIELMQELEPRLEFIYEPGLYRPQRWQGDWEGDPQFTRTAEQAERYQEIITSSQALFGIPDVNPGLLKKTVGENSELRWVHTTAAGGGAQVKAAGLTTEELERVAFSTSAGVHGSTLAEFALFGVLAGAKNLRKLEADQANKFWPSERWGMRHLDEMTILVVGLGGIGTAVAERYKACGSTVWGTSRSGHPVAGVDRLIDPSKLAEVAGQVDAIVATLPGTKSTEGLLGADVFEAVREGTIFVNVGRGTVVDESALIPALQAGRIGFAALDVVAQEPLDPNSVLWDHPNVLISPHTAALSSQETTRIARLFAHNATCFLDGQDLRNKVDTVEFY